MRKKTCVPNRDFKSTFHNVFSIQPERLVEYIKKATESNCLIPAQLLVHIAEETRVPLMNGDAVAYRTPPPSDAWVDPKQFSNLWALIQRWRMHVY